MAKAWCVAAVVRHPAHILPVCTWSTLVLLTSLCPPLTTSCGTPLTYWGPHPLTNTVLSRKKRSGTPKRWQWILVIFQGKDSYACFITSTFGILSFNILSSAKSFTYVFINQGIVHSFRKSKLLISWFFQTNYLGVDFHHLRLKAYSFFQQKIWDLKMCLALFSVLTIHC